jgi:hypothetical protein
LDPKLESAYDYILRTACAGRDVAERGRNCLLWVNHQLGTQQWEDWLTGRGFVNRDAAHGSGKRPFSSKLLARNAADLLKGIGERDSTGY